MGGTTMLVILRILCVVLGVLTAAWGVYDMFGEGQQSSMGIKKIIGGIAFALVAALIFTWAIAQIKEAAAQAGIEACVHVFNMLPVHITGFLV